MSQREWNEEAENLFDSLLTIAREIGMVQPGYRKPVPEVLGTKTWAFYCNSESTAVPEGYRGLVYLQYESEQRVWTICEFFTPLQAGVIPHPGRPAISTRNFFEAMTLLGHWSGYSNRIYPEET